jgi:HAD superfamily hydrolase (TIGR01509 family)
MNMAREKTTSKRSMQAVIFDMDGVIVNSEPSHERAFLEVLEEIGFGDRHGIQLSNYIGRSDRETWEDFLSRHTPVQTIEELLAMKRERVIKILKNEQPVFEGLRELIRRLATTYKLAVASGSERAVVQEVLALPGLQNFFPVVVSCADVQRGKPAPDIFLKAAERLNVRAEECWVIEDSKPGIAGALAAGMRVIAITNTYEASELNAATHVVQTYQQIGDLLVHKESVNTFAQS